MGLHFKRLMVLGLLGAAAAGCSSTTPAMPNPITEPMIDQPGRHIVRFRDTVIEIVVDSKFAANSLGDEWLILNTAMSGMAGGATMVDRKMMSIRTPDGRTIPMPSYREFNAAYDELATAARRAEMAADPLGFTRAGRRDCRIDFFPIPGSGRSARTALNVTKNQLCVGLLFFPVKGGIQPGNWRLIVDFEETRAVVPFTLEVKE